VVALVVVVVAVVDVVVVAVVVVVGHDWHKTWQFDFNLMALAAVPMQSWLDHSVQNAGSVRPSQAEFLVTV